jgi:DNA-binding PadR family transcriptional regulator
MKEKKSLKNLLLVLICAHDGEYTWYQLERELEWRGLGGKVMAGTIANKLVAESLVTKEIHLDKGPGLPVYRITAIGREKAKELVRQYGINSFEIKRQDPNDYVVE